MTRWILCTLILMAGANAAAAEDWRITTAGYGPVKIGMSVEQAAQALGTKLVAEGPVDDPECHYVRPEPEVEGLWFMISGDRVVRIEVTAAGITTKSGLGVGDSEDRVKELFPRRRGHAAQIRRARRQLPHRVERQPQDRRALRNAAGQGDLVLRRPSAASGICRGLLVASAPHA